MTTLYLREGKTIEHTNAGSAISSGDVVIIGETFGVATVDIAASGGVGTVAIEGVFSLPKNGSALVAGNLIDWDASASAFSPTVGAGATGDMKDIAICMKAAAGGDTTVEVKLQPGSGAVTA